MYFSFQLKKKKKEVEYDVKVKIILSIFNFGMFINIFNKQTEWFINNKISDE